ncbi:MAG: hypothetical protein LBN97_04645 [Oscillospiraceae bacterium]|jgi:hypothetical protein|nr:hypothetical protein [Oscillospiraceae bacterium]
MCCKAIAQYGKRRKTARLLAAFICVCFVAALVLASAFIVVHGNHEHDTNGTDGACAVCACVSAAGNLLKAVSSAAAVCVFAFGAIFAALRLLKSLRLDFAVSTLTSVKIRLNN